MTIQKINILLEGLIGTGKTSSLKTILTETDKNLFILATEPGIDTIFRELEDLKEAADRLHWAYVAPASVDWGTLISNADQVNKLPPDALQKTNMSKRDYQQFVEVLNLCSDFICQRPGCSCKNKSHGPVDEFTPESIFAIDGLSGLSKMSMQLTAGAKPIRTQPEWGIAQETLRQFIDKLTGDTKCSFVLIAHMDRNLDHISGGTFKTVSTIGQKLAPDIPKPFDEVVYCDRRGDNFFWSTVESNTDLKSRYLPFDDEITPTFAHFFPKESKS